MCSQIYSTNWKVPVALNTSPQQDCKQIRKIESMAPVFPAKDNSGSVWIISALHVKAYASVIHMKHTSHC